MSSAGSWTDFIFSLFNCWTRPHSPVGLLPHSSHDVVLASADRGRVAVPAPPSAFVPAPVAFAPAPVPAATPAPVVVVLEGDDQDDGNWEDWNDSVVVDEPAPLLAAAFPAEPPPSQTAAPLPSIFNPVPPPPPPSSSIFNPVPTSPLPSIFNPVPTTPPSTTATAAEPAEEPEEDLFADMTPVYVAPARLQVEQPRPVQSIPQDALSDHAASSPSVSQPVQADVFDDEPVEGHGAWSDDEPIFAGEDQGRQDDEEEKAAAEQEQPAPARQGKRTKKERVRVTKASVSFHDDDF